MTSLLSRLVPGQELSVLSIGVQNVGLDNPTNVTYGLDALILSMRFDWRQFGLGFSYDVNLSELKAASNGNGAFEFSLIYSVCGPEKRHVFCPKF